MAFFSWLSTKTKGAAAGGVALGVAPGGDVGVSGSPWAMWPRLMPSSRIDYATEAGDLTANAIIMACVQWIGRTFPEAPIRVMQRGKTHDVAIPGHPLTGLLARPNDYYNGLLLWQATLLSYNVAGNAYWLKVRNGAGRVVELWYEPDFTCRPVWPSDGSRFISGYQVRRAGQWRDVALEDVIHFRQGLDPRNPRLGLSPLGSALREVFTDNEAANFSASLLRNMGIPGMVISPATADATIADPQGLKDTIVSKFGGDRRGEPLVMQGPTKVELLSFSPEQMNYEKLRRIPEERISALIGIPAIVAGLGAGLDRATYANMKEAREAAYHNNLLPTHRLLAAQLGTDLVPEFGDGAREFVEFDISKVQALADDVDARYKRVVGAWNAGLLKRGEGRLALDGSFPVDAKDDVYKSDLLTLAARVTELEPPGTLISDDPDLDTPAATPSKPAKDKPNA